MHMNKILSFLLTCFLTAGSAATAACPAQQNPGGIIFIGDSITQGGRFTEGMLSSSYRYPLFKHFVDHGLEFRPMGMAQGAAQHAPVQTPDYRGVSFPNVHEAAASGRSYQPASHPRSAPNNKQYRPNPNTILPATCRGPLGIKFGQGDSFTGKANVYFDGAAETVYEGPTFNAVYGDTKAQTACVLIGINDLYDRAPRSDSRYAHSFEEIVENTHRITTTLQAYNPEIRVIVMQLLPVGKLNDTHDQGIDAYNALLREAVSTWSTAHSCVTCADVSAGFYAENGEMIDTARGAHPTAQGELLIAGNLARVLGVPQRTLGYARKGAAELAAQADLSSTTPAIRMEGSVEHFRPHEPGDAALRTAAHGGLCFDFQAGTPANWLQLDLPATTNGTASRVGTYEFCVQMRHSEQAGAENYLSIFVGDGAKGAGQLSVGEDGIFWGNGSKGVLLYGAPYSPEGNHRFTQAASRLRIVADHSAQGSVFHVWLGDQLIGEGLRVNLQGHYANTLLIGKASSVHACAAELSSLALEPGTPCAPATH